MRHILKWLQGPSTSFTAVKQTSSSEFIDKYAVAPVQNLPFGIG